MIISKERETVRRERRRSNNNCHRKRGELVRIPRRNRGGCARWPSEREAYRAILIAWVVASWKILLELGRGRAVVQGGASR